MRADPAEYKITPRESAVLALLCDGLTAHAIGTRLGIKAATVTKHTGISIASSVCTIASQRCERPRPSISFSLRPETSDSDRPHVEGHQFSRFPPSTAGSGTPTASRRPSACGWSVASATMPTHGRPC
ncbi:LuxR C-terminal-related transcriptional regulator [Nocardia gamkensis]|uniref:LuxR C-terminal-related transcriptional regulator n=1 Tax=Nocardia gamkensis TaxID=352869 RepID=UPI0033C005C7